MNATDTVPLNKVIGNATLLHVVNIKQFHALQFNFLNPGLLF